MSKVLYKRVVKPLLPGDTGDTTHKVHEFTGGIVHMLDSSVWLTRDEVIAESVKYNLQNDGPFDGHFETDPLIVAEYLGLLCQVGLAVARIELDEPAVPQPKVKLQPRRYKDRCSCRSTKFRSGQWDTDCGQGYPGTGAAHIWKSDVKQCQGCKDEVGLSKSGKPYSRPTK